MFKLLTGIFVLSNLIACPSDTHTQSPQKIIEQPNQYNQANQYDNSLVLPGMLNRSENTRMDTRGNLIFPGLWAPNYRN